MESKPFDKLHDRVLFDCEVEPLNVYLKNMPCKIRKKMWHGLM
jgi:hypothetical protein